MRTSFVKRVGVAAAAALGLGLASGASAQGVYVGGAYSWATASVEDVSAELIDDNANAYKLFLGYEFPAILGLEAGYVDFGDYDVGHFEDAGSSTGTLNSSGWTVALTGRIPLGDALSIYGKLGRFFWDAEIRAAEDIGDLANSGQDPFYGAGLRVNIGKVSIFGEYEHFSGEQIKNDLFSLGVRFTF